ncbi:hypothetical protein JRO89_XS01G0002600 [Xanthoceras sorbifolium]|uniref:Zinc finger, CCHC-type n=1 Tax=Xanthoceras sorbifolium TaxID=99658 RepID=A0ABQ8IHI0_9ROSI|nr:hypothetical protein JRO89_XS01G0002600 [Xanthoceras sorbifolium]
MERLMKNETLSTSRCAVSSSSLSTTMCTTISAMRLMPGRYGISLNSYHLNEMQGILDQLSRMNINFDDEVFVIMVLVSLLELWETLKISIINSAPNGAVNMELVKSGILNEEMRRRSQASSSSSQPDVLAEKDVPSANGDSTDLELVPPTPVPRQVEDEGQVDEPDEDDAPIEVGSEDEEDLAGCLDHKLLLPLYSSDNYSTEKSIQFRLHIAT